MQLGLQAPLPLKRVTYEIAVYYFRGEDQSDVRVLEVRPFDFVLIEEVLVEFQQVFGGVELDVHDEFLGYLLCCEYQGFLCFDSDSFQYLIPIGGFYSTFHLRNIFHKGSALDDILHLNLGKRGPYHLPEIH